MSKPKLLDLFCGAGGCAKGYHDAGFEVIGVDLNPQPRFPYEFHQADALEYLDTADLSQFAVIHASPPCQHYTLMLNNNQSRKDDHPDLIDIIRDRLLASGKPYIIENVVGSPVRNPIMLCGAMFGLRVYRHRLFESNIYLYQPQHPRHKLKAAHAGTTPKKDEFYCPIGHFADMKGSKLAMGIDWEVTKPELAQAIPPAYTRYIGQQLLAYIDGSRLEAAS